MDYQLIRSDRRTLCIEISREEAVKVRVPRRCSQAEIEAFLERKQPWMERALARQRARAETRPDPTPEQAAALLAQARQVIPDRVAYYAQVMGLSPTGVRITAARTRLGSCSPKNRLCFSLHLMSYPREAIDYVVVHELSHIRHKNHGAAFHALVRSVLPDERERRVLLRW